MTPSPAALRRATRALRPAGALAVLGLLLAACGSGPPAHAVSTTTSPPSSTTSTTSASSTTTTAPSGSTTSTSPSSSTTSTIVPVNGNVSSCTTGNLSFALGSSSGSAGAIDYALVLTNTGSLPCYLYGYPGVAAVTGASGSQLGLAAQRATQLGPASFVTLKPGAMANADLHVTEAGNYPSATCKLVTAAGFRVYPPGETQAAFFPASIQVCSADVTGQLTVGPVAAGAASQVNGG